jgi:hypothetical protein
VLPQLFGREHRFAILPEELPEPMILIRLYGRPPGGVKHRFGKARGEVREDFVFGEKGFSLPVRAAVEVLGFLAGGVCGGRDEELVFVVTRAVKGGGRAGFVAVFAGAGWS